MFQIQHSDNFIVGASDTKNEEVRKKFKKQETTEAELQRLGVDFGDKR